MRAIRLHLTDFRNYPSLDIKPGEGMNILHGQNAQGKTNVLEALLLLATTRSLRAGKEAEMIRVGAERAIVWAEADREKQGETEIEVTILPGERKSVAVNRLKRGKVLDLLGQFNAVFFGSSDLPIVAGEPADRRHFLNMEISQISPRYVYDLGHYRRILAQRNRLLRDMRDCPGRRDTGLEAWTEQLISYGAALLERRRFYLARLAPLAGEAHRQLTEGKETLEMKYLPGAALPEEYETQVQETNSEERYLAEAEKEGEASILPPLQSDAAEIARMFRKQIENISQEEMRRGTTLIGPQRDDLSFLINGADVRTYGSQGQQRTVALALKLAEFRLIEEYVGEPPVLLLDDVMSDLDDLRRRRLLSWTRRRCQTFLTCTNLRSFPKELLSEAARFKVAAGVVTAEGA